MLSLQKWITDVFGWFADAILVYHWGTRMWHLHTKHHKIAWNVSVNNLRMVYHTDVRIGEVVYVLVFYNISFSWTVSNLFFFMSAKWHDSENDLLSVQMYMLVLNIGCEIQNFCGNFTSLSKEFERNLRDTCIRFLERFLEKSSTFRSSVGSWKDKFANAGRYAWCRLTVKEDWYKKSVKKIICNIVNGLNPGVSVVCLLWSSGSV